MSTVTPGSVDAHPRRAPVLILGLGNLLLGDDGAGLRLLGILAARKATGWGDGVEFLDGGTLGLALAGEISGRRAVVILDAVRAGASPGTVHLLHSPRAARGALYAEANGSGPLPFRSGGPATAHGGNAQELIATVALLGQSPEELFVIGIEPETMNTGIGLSASVERAIGPAARRAVELVEQQLRQCATAIEGASFPCA